MGSAGSTSTTFRKSKLASWDQLAKSSLGIDKRSGSDSFLRVVGEDLAAAEGEQRPHSEVTISVCGMAQGFKKDQDRFVVVPRLLRGGSAALPSVVLAGVFDGHGRDGDIVAEQLAASVPKALQSRLADALEAQYKKGGDGKDKGGCISDGSGPEPLRLESEAVRTALVETFAGIQAALDAEFETEVVGPMMKLKAEIEAAQKVALGSIALPAGSGATATVLMVVSDRLFVAHVGDSRAVLVCRNPVGPGVLAKALTDDHNVSSSTPEELQAIEDAGGTVMGKHLLAPNVDGGLELTRSLGDVPLHRSGLVRHEPAILCVPLLGGGDNGGDNDAARAADLVQTAPLFAFAASDGLWDNFDDQEAATFMHDSVAKARAEKPAEALDVLLLEAAKLIQDESAARATAKGRRSDDISVVTVVLANDSFQTPQAAVEASAVEASAVSS